MPFVAGDEGGAEKKNIEELGWRLTHDLLFRGNRSATVGNKEAGVPVEQVERK